MPGSFSLIEGELRGKRVAEPASPGYELVDPDTLLKMLEDQMRKAAVALDFESAARLRDQLFEVKARMNGAPPPHDEDAGAASATAGANG